MTHTNFIILALAGITASLWLNTALHAQSPDEIIITANLAPTPLAQVGSSVSVLDGATLEVLGNPVATDFLRMVPSLAVSRSGGVGGFTEVRIRGAEARHTLVYIEGIKANDPAAASEFGFAELLGDGISRIEVLRGPQSALYGSEAIGGVINIITKTNVHYIKAEGGSYGTAQLSGGWSVNRDRFDVAVLGAYYRTNGINFATVGSENDGSQVATVQVNAKLKPTDAGALGLTVRYTAQNAQSDPEIDFGTVLADGNQLAKTRRLYMRGYAHVDALDGRWSHELSGTVVDARTQNFAAKVITDPALFTDEEVGGRTTMRYQTALGFKMGAVDQFLTAAAQYERESFSTVNSSDFAGNSFNTSQRQSRTQASLTGQYHAGFTKRVFVDASLRHDFNGGARNPANNFQDITTWRASVSALLADSIRLHASVGRGSTNPTFVSQFGFFPGSFIGNPLLRPEQSTGWELGGEWHAGATRIDMTYFSNRIQDFIDGNGFDVVTLLTTAINKPGISKHHGIELTAQTRIGPVKLSGFYSYLKATDPSGVDLNRRPNHQASFTASSSILNKLVVAGSLNYNGNMRDADFRNLSPPLYASTPVILKSYVLASVSAHYKVLNNTEIFARVENAFNQNYQDVFGYRAPRAGVYGGVKVNFDK